MLGGLSPLSRNSCFSKRKQNTERQLIQGGLKVLEPMSSASSCSNDETLTRRRVNPSNRPPFFFFFIKKLELCATNAVEMQEVHSRSDSSKRCPPAGRFSFPCLIEIILSVFNVVSLFGVGRYMNPRPPRSHGQEPVPPQRLKTLQHFPETKTRC